jgi:lipopolysaccharide transport system ATP-binding protein
MSDIAVQTVGLSKHYRLGTRPAGRLTESLSAAFSRPFRPRDERPEDSLWALRDVSIDVGHGEVVGIIGRNGAGKSTLLKILARITEPTSGYALIDGRVGALLEVGSGFHGELTGAENVYLSGAMLGMSRREVKQKFDEIVAFAEIERFLGTPVKRYSSGMYMRLAFSVAAHLEPDVLIVDEVLAVGDAAFQRKCLGKMENVAAGGRTVLFVSHNLAAVSSLCSRAYLLDQGRLVFDGAAGATVSTFLSSLRETERIPLNDRHDRGGDSSVRITSISIADAQGGGVVSCQSSLRITLEYESPEPLRNAQFSVTIYDTDYTGMLLFDSDAEPGLPDVLPARGTITCTTDPIDLTPGPCFVNVAATRGGILADHVEYAGRFDIEADDVLPSGRVPSRDRVIAVRRHQWHAGSP